MKHNMLRALLGAGLLAACLPTAWAGDAVALDASAPDGAATQPDGTVAADAQWRVWGGQVGFRWNEELLGHLGLRREEHGALGTSKRADGLPQYALRDAPALQFGVNNGAFTGFSGGALSLRGGVDLVAKGGRASLRDMRLVARPGDPLKLDVHGSDGVAWLYIDRMMYEIEGDRAQVLSFKTMDLRIAPALADLLGNPNLVGISLADIAMDTHVYGSKPIPVSTKRGSNKWPGSPVPGVDGAVYEADVFMHDFDVVLKRMRSITDGPGGADGGVVYAPSSTLRNNRIDLTVSAQLRPTVPSMTPRAEGGAMPASDPLGTSTVHYAADVPWHAKFTGNNAPYGNDQHPFLIWNLFRVDASGRIDQIGRSGVKHAWLTTNSPCDVSSPGGDILGRGCADTYSDGNNDALNDLGPRSELVPADGLWGRCGSVWDRNCDGNRDAQNPALPAGCTGSECGPFAYRMEVKESDIDPAANPGATYFFESWYIVREDVNIYNTMQSRPVTFAWESGIWNVDNGLNANLRLGPALDRWVNHATPAAQSSSADIEDPQGGHARVAAKVTDLGAGGYRYDYAVMNFDVARAETSGAEPNLRVLSNDGFTAFSLPIDAALPIDGFEFSDGDKNTANDWAATREGNRVVWRAPAGNALNWGTMYRFGVITASPPVQAVAVLTTAETDLVEELQAEALVPQSEAVQTFAVGGTLTGLAADGEISLRLNNGAPLVLDADDDFVFTNEVLDGGAYTVTVISAPVTQSCEVANGTGTIEGAHVTDVVVTCADLPPPSYTIGGTATGLANGRSVTLELNGEEQLVRSGNGAFVFEQLLVEGDAYTVTLVAQPADRNCSIQNPSGTANANVTNVIVACDPLPTYALGGNVEGLGGSGAVELRLNNAEVQRYSANGPFTLQTRLVAGRPFDVAVTSQPPGRVCVVQNGSGTMPAADVTDILVSCTVQETYSIGGTLAGLPSGTTVALLLNGGTPMPVSLNGAFNFPGELPAGASYTITVGTQPAGRHCSVSQGTGVVGTDDLRSVQVVCALRGIDVFESGFE